MSYLALALVLTLCTALAQQNHEQYGMRRFRNGCPVHPPCICRTSKKFRSFSAPNENPDVPSMSSKDSIIKPEASSTVISIVTGGVESIGEESIVSPKKNALDGITTASVADTSSSTSRLPVTTTPQIPKTTIPSVKLTTESTVDQNLNQISTPTKEPKNHPLEESGRKSDISSLPDSESPSGSKTDLTDEKTSDAKEPNLHDTPDENSLPDSELPSGSKTDSIDEKTSDTKETNLNDKPDESSLPNSGIPTDTKSDSSEKDIDTKKNLYEDLSSGTAGQDTKSNLEDDMSSNVNDTEIDPDDKTQQLVDQDVNPPPNEDVVNSRKRRLAQDDTNIRHWYIGRNGARRKRKRCPTPPPCVCPDDEPEEVNDVEF